jgi:hypothetical protein
LSIADLSSGYLVFISVYHLWTGGVSFFAPDFALHFYRAAYGCDPQERRQLLLVLRPWGALAIFAGLAGFVALGVVEARPWIIASLIVLLVLRIAYRVMLRAELREMSRINGKRNAFSIGLLILGVILLGMDFIPHWANGR